MTMATESIYQEMMKYFMQLNDAERKSVLQMLKTFLQNKSLPSERISIEQYNKELAEAEARIESGEFTTQEDLEKEINEW
jgi:hypothetical protein